jgi:hypothetical protein
MRSLVTFFIAAFIVNGPLESQSTVTNLIVSDTTRIEENDHLDHTHELHDHSNHDHHHSWEVGFAAGWVRLLSEEENAPGFHFHILRSIGKENKFSVGPGLEYIADEHKHIATVISFGYRPVHPLYLGVSPGIAFPLDAHDEHSEPTFAGHLEALYEFEFDFFHIGPMVEYSWGVEDKHFMAGLHIGLPF